MSKLPPPDKVGKKKGKTKATASNARKVVVEGQGEHGTKTLRLTVYDKGWDIYLAIGGPDPDTKAQGRLALSVQDARNAAAALTACAEKAEMNREQSA